MEGGRGSWFGLFGEVCVFACFNIKFTLCYICAGNEIRGSIPTTPSISDTESLVLLIFICCTFELVTTQNVCSY
jgi:hypothetical protein